MLSFVPLQIHSEYSIEDGIVRIKPLIAKLREQNVPACALTDKMNLFALVKFYKTAVKQGIKPIIGCDINLHNPDEPDRPWQMTLLCQNEQGYLHLKQLLGLAYLEGQINEVPQIQRRWLEEKSDGLIALSGGRQGDIGQALLQRDTKTAKQYLNFWQTHFHDRYYIELQRTGHPDENDYNQQAYELAAALQLPVVATNATRFIDKADFSAHEARVCIHDGYQLSDPRREKRYTEQQFLRSPQEMQTLFSDIPEALENSIEIAKRCNVQLDFGKNYLPNFPIPDGMTIESFLKQQAEIGLEKRLAQVEQLGNKDNNIEHNEYEERLTEELNVINGMGFPGYFLIVADFIKWAKEHGIPVGPGRGSGAGSLVAYCLEITDLDPLHYALLFERFLNPERVSMPDFDIDFCMEGRDTVIDYVARTYGRESVSQIITFGTMAAKAVVRDCGRVLGHAYGFVDKIAKLIPFELGITLEKALEQEPQLQQRYTDEEEVKSIIDLALKLEGITRNAGKHAGGVVIAPSALTDFTPLYCEPDGDNLVTQFDKDDVEAIGLVKFDFLGLRTLTIIDWALQTVNQLRVQNQQDPIDITMIDMADVASFDLLKDCNTTAVFQLESRGMKDLIKRLQPDCFEDIIALVALFRPGPLQSGMVDDFINRKHGLAKVEYAHPKLEPILKPTYGVILYQEQVMQIAQELAGYTLGGADLLRRAMGKKKPEEMAKQRDIFLTGAKENNIDEETATYIFDLMEKFAGYGFNKSHSAAYALVSYQTAWLKAHYPAPFMAAVLSSDMDNTDKVVGFVEDCQKMQLKVVPPDVNHSQYKFTVVDDMQIRYGLGAIKGIGESAIESIVIAAKEAPFEDLFDFCRRVDLRKVNRRAIETLIRSGAMDNIGPHRAAMSASVDKALKLAEQHALNQEYGQHDLFGVIATNDSQNNYLDMPELDDEQRLLGEKETLGLYLTGHPIDRYSEEFSHFVSGKTSELERLSEFCTLAGLVISVRKLMTKRGKPMAILVLDDHHGRVDVTVFSEQYETYLDYLQKDIIIVAQGALSRDEYTGGFRLTAEHLWAVEKARERFAKSVQIKLHQRDVDDNLLAQLHALLQTQDPGQTPVNIEYVQDNASVLLNLGQQFRITPTDAFLKSLKNLLGDAATSVVY